MPYESFTAREAGFWTTSSSRFDRLIEDLLHYSRLDAETPTRTDIDLPHLVEVILADRKQVIAERDATVNVSLGVTHARLWERGVLQTLTNLIDNALKYSREARPPRIQVASESRSDGVRITISDNGIGFDMK